MRALSRARACAARGAHITHGDDGVVVEEFPHAVAREDEERVLAVERVPRGEGRRETA